MISRSSDHIERPLQDYQVFCSGTDATAEDIGMDRLVAVTGRLVSLSKPKARGRRVFRTLTFADLIGDMETVSAPIFSAALVEEAQYALRTGMVVVVYGAFINGQELAALAAREGAPPRKGARRRKGDEDDEPPELSAKEQEEMRFYVHAIRRASKPTLYCRGASEYKEEVDRTLSELIAAGDGAIQSHILGLFHPSHGVATASLSARFQRAEKITILQALSHGMVRRGVSDRLHIISVSPPGCGKKVLSDLGNYVSSVAEYVQPGLVTPAGLAARVEYSDGWKAQPGVMARASGGMVILEDIHRFEKSDLNAIRSILMGTLEDARVAPAKAAHATYECRAAVHMSANPQSVLGGAAEADPDDPAARLRELNLPFDVLSRVDVVLPLGAGEDAAQAAIEMVIQELPEGCGYRDPDGDPEPVLLPPEERAKANKIKLLVARLIERFPVIKLSPVGPALVKLMRDLTLVIRQASAKLSGAALQRVDPEGFFRRMANTVRKLLGGLARLNGRAHATEADVAEVWEILQGKLEMISWVTGQTRRIQPLGNRAQAVNAASETSEDRFLLILRSFGGEQVGAEAMADALEISVRALHREFKDRGYSASQGFYEVPLEDDYRAERSSRELRGETVEPAPPAEDDDMVAGAVAPAPARLDIADLVPPLPVEMRPMAVAVRLSAADLENEHMLSRCFFKLAAEEEQFERGCSTMVEAMLRVVQHSLDVPNRQAVIDWLSVPDWDERGHRVLSMMVASDFPGYRQNTTMWIDDRTPFPPRLRGTLEKIMERSAAFAAELKRRREVELRRRHARVAYGGIAAVT